MDIDKAFDEFIEFPEGSSGNMVTTVSTKLFAKYCTEKLQEENERLLFSNRYKADMYRQIDDERKRLQAEVEQLQAQLNAAKRGMDSAAAAGRLMLEKGQKLAAENSPEAIESEREANAVLTAEVEHLQKQNDYLSALASGQPLYGLEEKIRDLMQRNKALQAEVERLRNTSKQCSYPIACEYVSELQQERDQLKAILQDVNSSDYRFSVDELAKRDAEVIENWLKKLPISNRAVRISDVRKSVRDYANQLRQQAKEVQS